MSLTNAAYTPRKWDAGPSRRTPSAPLVAAFGPFRLASTEESDR